jgi:uroporphyrinogen-III synthase
VTGTETRRLFLWVTRTVPFAMLTAKHLHAAGHNPLMAPVLETRSLPHRLEADGIDALVFTSPNGVRHHAFDPALSSVPVFAVGERTASTARQTGYENVLSAGGNVHDLRALICKRLTAPARLAHLSAAKPAGNLVAELCEAGFDARHIPIYEAVECGRDTLRPALAALPWIDGVLIHSPRAGAIVAGFLDEMGGHWDGIAYCISPAAAAPFERLRGIATRVAPHPNDAALRGIVGLPAATGLPPVSNVVAFPQLRTIQAWGPDDPVPPSAA